MNVFGPGPRLDAPQGDVGRQAVAALRGYAYQIYASAVAWLGLADFETLHLEVAEDFSIVGQEAIAGTQVRDTAGSGRITLQSDVTRAAIDSFVDLTLRNRGRKVIFHYLTTSEVGLERESAKRIAGGPALHYWRRAAAGSDVEPLRRLIDGLDLLPSTRDYLSGLSDGDFRRSFLACVHWHCGEPGLHDVRVELEAGLIEFVSSARRLPSAMARQIVPAVVEAVLLRAVSKGERHLRRSDLLALLDDASRVSVPIGRLSDAIGGGGFARAPLLMPTSDLPMPDPCAPRSALVRTIDGSRRASGAVFVTGTAGLGKSLTARLVAGSAEGAWSIVDFRDLGAADAAARLGVLLGEIGASPPAGIVLDDLNETDDPRVRDQLARILAALRRRDATAIITAYRAPALSTLHALCPGGAPAVEVPYLDQAEVRDLVVRAGGDAKFAGSVYRAAANGHPLMTMSLVLQLSASGWSRGTLARLLGPEGTGELADERRAARTRLMAAMPTDVSKLLLRTSLVGGRFDRDMAIALGEIDSPVPLPGVSLDRLIGAWIEPLGRNRFRVSPLLEGAAEQVLGDVERRRIHHCIAERMLRADGLAVDDADMVTRHTLRSGDPGLAAQLAGAIISCGEDMLETLSAFSGTLQRMSHGRPVLPGHPAPSAILRFAQLLTLLPHGSSEAIRSCWEILRREGAAVGSPETFELANLSKLLLHPRASQIFPDWIDLLARLDHLMAKHPTVVDAAAALASAHADPPHPTGVLLASQMRSIETVALFRTLVEQLDGKDPLFRQRALSSFRPGRGDVSILVNQGWLRESRGRDFDWERAAADYAACADVAMRWGDAGLAARCSVAQAICLDENGDDMDRALETLREAESRFGSDAALVRARAKIHWRRRDHLRALPLLSAAADAADAGGQDALERAYIAREAAISSAELGDWAASESWFERARSAALTLSVPSVRAMATGLLADIGFAAASGNNPRRGFERFREAVLSLPTVDPQGTLAEAYCHRIIRHGVLWLFRRVCDDRAPDEENAAFAPGSGSNIEPLEAIREHPILPIDYSIYMLVDVDLSLPQPTGYLSTFRADLVAGPILSSEICLAVVTGRNMLRSSRTDGFVDQLRLCAALGDLLRDRTAPSTLERLQNPERGRVPLASVDDGASQEVRLAAEDFLLTFGIVAGLSGRTGALDVAIAAGLAEPELRLLHPLLKDMAGAKRRRTAQGEWIAAAVHGLRTVGAEGPAGVLWAGIWLLLHARVTKWGEVAIPPIVDWIFERWSILVGTARFALLDPALTVPGIEAALNDPERSPAAAARLVLAAAPSTGVPIRAPIIGILQGMATVPEATPIAAGAAFGRV